MKTRPTSPTRGRPRTFDEDKALDAAMRVFWKFGYEGASLPALTKAMGINRPSMYAAFGNKEALFRKAVDRYVARAGDMFSAALAAPTAREAVERLWKSAVGGCSATGKSPRGCLLVQGALACGEESDAIRRELAHRRADSETLLRERFERARAQGDLRPGIDPAALAKYVAAFQQGLAVQAAGGVSSDALLKAVDVALAGWPG
jgi:AcrR family transcriptional regulator